MEVMHVRPPVFEKDPLQSSHQRPPLLALAHAGRQSPSAHSPAHSPPLVRPSSSPSLPVHTPKHHMTQSRSMELLVANPRTLPRGISLVPPTGGAGMRSTLPAPGAHANCSLLPQRLVPPKGSPMQDSTRFLMPTLPTLPRSPSGQLSFRVQRSLVASPVQGSRLLKQQLQPQHTLPSEDEDSFRSFASPRVDSRSSSLDSTRNSQLCIPQLSHSCVLPCEALPDSCAQTSILPDPSDEACLAVGSVVQMEDKTFCLTDEIGKGSFGKVWGAKLLGGEHCAQLVIKEVTCRSHQALAEATFEGSLLAALRSDSDRKISPEVTKCIPTLFRMRTDMFGSQSWRVLLAMSRVPGQPLWEYLERRLAGQRCVADAVNLAKEMLAQLVPVLEFISRHAYHRDVTPRNILIESCDGKTLRFGLIDFGLAVDATYWRLGVKTLPSLQDGTGIPAWQGTGVSGDGRYWPVSSWYMFCYGPQELERRPELCIEYKMQLDLHSLGLSTLQSFTKMLPAENKEDDRTCVPESGFLLVRLYILHARWKRYWKDASKLWRRIFETFKQDGDFQVLKDAYGQACVHQVIHSNVLSLRSALHELKETAQAEQQGAASNLQLCSQISSLADELLKMIGTSHKATF